MTQSYSPTASHGSSNSSNIGRGSRSHAPPSSYDSKPAAPPGRPFDIREYTAALNAAATTARDLHDTLQSTQALIESPALPAHIAEADHTLQKLIATIALWSLAVILFATICVYACVRLLRRPAGSRH